MRTIAILALATVTGAAAQAKDMMTSGNWMGYMSYNFCRWYVHTV